jgi:hypothetical protein
MATPWHADIQRTAQLTIFPGGQLKQAPSWGMNLFQRVLFDFNRLSRIHSLGVTFAPSTQEPQRNGMGANVLFDASNGSCKFFDRDGKDQTESLDVTPGKFKGMCLRNEDPVGTSGQFKLIKKAFIFVPFTPLLKDKSRAVGIGPRIAIALHELFHACGLDSSDPGHDQPSAGPLDFYSTDQKVVVFSIPDFDQMQAPDGTTVADDTLQFSITARTAALVQSVWLLGRT